MTRKFSLCLQENADKYNSQQSVIAEFAPLPFLPDSVDMIILPHILEFMETPEELLHDIWTSLMPNGYLLVINFNPFSL